MNMKERDFQEMEFPFVLCRNQIKNSSLCKWFIVLNKLVLKRGL